MQGDATSAGALSVLGGGCHVWLQAIWRPPLMNRSCCVLGSSMLDWYVGMEHVCALELLHGCTCLGAC
jgi:hypothetical protein